MEGFWTCFGWFFMVLSLCVPYVLFSGEPDLIDAFIFALMN